MFEGDTLLKLICLSKNLKQYFSVKSTNAYSFKNFYDHSTGMIIKTA